MSELLGANTDVLDRNAQSLTADARRLQDIRIEAARAMAELRASWQGLNLIRLTQQWEQEASPLLADAYELLATCAALLRAQSAEQRAASSAEDGCGGGLPALGVAPIPMTEPTSPPKHGSPAANAAWWRSLDQQQQQRVIEEHPDWIGNRDGVTFEARDLANRALLTADRARLMADLKRLDAQLDGPWSGSLLTDDSLGLDRVQDELASLDALEATLAQPGERQLLLLDVGQERALAAVSQGNVETAANVAVLVPGMSTTVKDSLMGLDQEMGQLRMRAEQEGEEVSATAMTAASAATAGATATVTWIGYRTPQPGWDLLRPDKSAVNGKMAQDGAERLVPFLQGIGAARDHDAHLTLLGHSYGSTTAGLALRQETGVDDAVFFGSPGLGTNHIEDLRIAHGHAFYIEARGDPVGDLGRFGMDPSHLDGIQHASAQESTVADPVTGQTRHLREVTGHSSYLLEGSTSQYNLSVVIAGVPQRRVDDPGEGLGDLFSWPIPGTY